MASWTNQDVNSLLPGEPWTSAKAIASFENPEAIAEGAAGAPVVEATWHATDSTTIGGGSALIYDHDVDGDVAEILSPTLESGYDYRLIGAGLESDSVSGAVGIEFGLSGGAHSGNATLPSGGSSAFDAVLALPMLAKTGVFLSGVENTSGDGVAPLTIGIFTTTGEMDRQYDRFRIANASGNDIIGGKLWLLRRKVEGF